MEPTISEFTIMFIIATAGMLVLAISIVIFVMYYRKKMLEGKLKRQELEADYQNKMLLASLESQENERKRLAAELHDSIGAMLSTVRISLVTSARNQEKPQSIDSVKQMIDETIESVRRISRDLMPATLEKFGLVHALRDLADQYSKVSGLQISCAENGTAASLPLSKQLVVFRIAQEFVNNAIKHSQGSHIEIILTWNENLEVSLRDNGRGFDLDEIERRNSGIGLFTMQNRAKMINGKFTLESAPQKGTQAFLTLPL